jgi:hypothetical protein
MMCIRVLMRALIITAGVNNTSGEKDERRGGEIIFYPTPGTDQY